MKISELPQTTELTGEELLAVVQNGETKKVTRDDLVGTVPDDIAIDKDKIALLSNGQKIGEGVSLPKITVDSELSEDSENPVQNQVVYSALANVDLNIQNSMHGVDKWREIRQDSVIQCSDVLSYNMDQEEKTFNLKKVKIYGDLLLDVSGVESGTITLRVKSNGGKRYFCCLQNIPYTSGRIHFVTEIDCDDFTGITASHTKAKELADFQGLQECRKFETLYFNQKGIIPINDIEIYVTIGTTTGDYVPILSESKVRIYGVDI